MSFADVRDHLVGFWKTRSVEEGCYQFCGTLIAPDRVLSVNHGIESGENLNANGGLWVRPFKEALICVEVVGVEFHPDNDLDAAVFLLKDPLQTPVAPIRWDYVPAIETSASVMSPFEGHVKSMGVSVRKFQYSDGQRYLTFAPRQNMGSSGGGVFVDGALIAVVSERYVNEDIGCAHLIFQLQSWLKDGGFATGYSTSEASENPSWLPKNGLLRRWLDREAPDEFKREIIQAAADLIGKMDSVAGVSKPRSAEHALSILTDPSITDRMTAMTCFFGAVLRFPSPHSKWVPWILAMMAEIARPALMHYVRSENGVQNDRIHRMDPSIRSFDAFVAAQLFGGQISASCLHSNRSDGLVKADWVFPVRVPPGCLDTENAILREAYRRFVSQKDPDAELECKPLADEELDELRWEVQMLINSHSMATAMVFEDALEGDEERLVNILSRVTDRSTVPILRVSRFAPEDNAAEPVNVVQISTAGFRRMLEKILPV